MKAFLCGHHTRCVLMGLVAPPGEYVGLDSSRGAHVCLLKPLCFWENRTVTPRSGEAGWANFLLREPSQGSGWGSLHSRAAGHCSLEAGCRVGMGSLKQVSAALSS